ncbi:MAG: hypothetical protein BWX69_03044 [Planctomycetes bacterium ADurb.Bin069]|nr:MAG: hypothetical protein BWX69_03044 [Planctomycetes bacterium ADurb.Bin069]
MATVYYLGDFADRCRIGVDSFWLPDGKVAFAQTAGGAPVRSQTAGRFWTGSVSLVPHYPDEQREIVSIIHALQEVDAWFNVLDPKRKFPRLDPGGDALGSATPTLGAVAGDGKSLDLDGLPVAYRLRPGDRLSFSYASGPVRIAYHEVLTSHQAGAGGGIGGMQVVPAVRPGWAAGAAVTLVRPACRAMMIPGSVRPGTRAGGNPGIEQGFSFDWVQVLGTPV